VSIRVSPKVPAARYGRRSFLAQMVATAGALAAVGCTTGPGSGTGRRRNIGLQLYTVRDYMREEIATTLQRVADLGYTNVEFAGYFGQRPKRIREIVKAAGLRAPSGHVEFEQITQQPDLTIATALEIGHEYVVLGWLPQTARRNLDDYRVLANRLNQFARRCADHGLRFAYHNHDFEFRPVDGVRPIDVLLAQTAPGLVDFELDLYWISKAACDSAAFLREHSGRVRMCHVKDMAIDGSIADVGAGTLDFENLLQIAASSGVRHYFVEHDEPKDGMASAANSLRALERLHQ